MLIAPFLRELLADAFLSVVTYKADATEVPQVEHAFKNAGLKNVKTFESAAAKQG